jgi:AcrR family transcriptional regulator
MARTPKVVEDRREQIIDAALRVFSQKGFTSATNKDIAREAGITPGLIYYYFESKEKLLEAILETRSPLRLVASPPQEIATMLPEDFLKLMIRRVLSILEGENFVQFIRVMIPEVIRNPEVTPLVAGFFQRLIGFLTSYFESKIETGELRRTDASLAAQVFIGSIIGFLLRRHIVRDPLALQYSHEQIADAVVETVLSGLIPRP